MKKCPYCNNTCNDRNDGNDRFHRLCKTINKIFEPFIVGTVYGLTICNMIAIGYWICRGIGYLIALVR